MDKILYVESDEEITSLVDRLRKIKQKEVGLVVPKRATLTQSIVNLKLLKKEASDLDKEVSIITVDKIGRNLASQVGFTVYQRLEGEEVKAEVTSPPKITPEISYKKPPFKKEEKAIPKSEIKEIKEEFPKKPTPILRPKKRRRPQILPSINKKFLFVFIVLSILILGFVGFLILPRAYITIYPKAEILPYDLDLTVSSNTKEVSYEASAIPGEILYIEKEESRNFQASGKKDVGEKAKGSITIYNEWDSNPQTLVANTRFLSSDGKLFRSAGEVTVPGTTVSEGRLIAGTASVSVVADQPGDQYNIGPSHFTIPGLPSAKQEKIYARSDSNMTGGFSKQVTIVSQDDVSKAQETLTGDLYVACEEELREKVDQDKKILDKTISKEVIESYPNIQVGAEANGFNLKLKVKVQAMVFSEDDLKDVSSSKLSSVLPSDKDLVYDGKNDVSYEIANLDLSSGVMVLKTHIEGLISSKIKQEELKQNLVGKNKQQAEEYLRNLERFEKVSVSLWPSWIKGIPKIKNNIKIDIQTAKPSEIKEIRPAEGQPE
jgi:hypothetical protein